MNVGFFGPTRDKIAGLNLGDTVSLAIWEGNRHSCHGVSKRARPALRRAMRAAGMAVYIAVKSDSEGNTYTSTGIAHRETAESVRERADWDRIVWGNSYSHCLHIIGGGDAREGRRWVN